MGARKAKPKPAKQAAAPTRALAGVAVKGLAALALVAGVVAGVVWLGQRAGERVADRDRYAVRVADISCDVPPGSDRATFLTEVRYLGDLPETVQSVDPRLPERLAAAFGKHPWVAEVTGVHVGPDAAVRVDLRFRSAVLLVRVAGEPEPRAVDRGGVLLPAPAAAPAELTTPVLPPTRPAGEVWDDPTVRRAAELAAEYKPRRVEKTDKGWRLTLESGKVLAVSP